VVTTAGRWHEVLAPGDLVLAAVSGGADSVALARLLHEEAPRRGLRLHLVHVNHRTRGADSDADAEFVADLARGLGLDCTVLAVDPGLLLRAAGESPEAALRAARLDLLRAHAAALGAAAIALGHHARDAAESFLLMALRGSGPTGLGSLREVRRLEPDGPWLIRPLLGETPESLRARLTALGQPWREDATNDDPRFRRNRLRAEVLPLLESLEPGAAATLARAAALCAEADTLLAPLVDEALARARPWQASGAAVLDAAAMRALPRALAALVLRGALRALDPAGGPDALPRQRETDDLLARIDRTDGPPTDTTLSTGSPVRITNRHVFLAHDRAAADHWPTFWKDRRAMILLPTAATTHKLLSSTQRATPATYVIELGDDQGELEFEVLDAGAFQPDWTAADFASHRAAALDARSVMRDLRLRAVGAGEEVLIGGGHRKAAGDVLAGAGIPADLRGRVGAVCDDRGILWIPGVRRAATGLVTPRTGLVLLARWRAKSIIP
jgi:tRNA(Ile)-lysidine synthase